MKRYIKSESDNKNSRIEVGMIVRYKPEWCDGPSDRKLLHIVMEDRFNDYIGQCWLIKTINSKLFIQPQEVVEDCMIEPTGFTVDDLVEGGL